MEALQLARLPGYGGSAEELLLRLMDLDWEAADTHGWVQPPGSEELLRPVVLAAIEHHKDRPEFMKQFLGNMAAGVNKVLYLPLRPCSRGTALPSGLHPAAVPGRLPGRAAVPAQCCHNRSLFTDRSRTWKPKLDSYR